MIKTLSKVQANILKNNRCILNEQEPKLTMCLFRVSTLSNFQMYLILSHLVLFLSKIIKRKDCLNITSWSYHH